MPNLQRIIAAETIFFQCDIQDPREGIYKEWRTIVENTKMLNKLADLNDIPLLVTEHNPERFSFTRTEVKETFPKNYFLQQKMTLSAVNKKVKEFLEKHKNRKTIVIYGLETHVCVLQSTLDLLDMGYKVFLVKDTIFSKNEIDRQTAFTRMKKAGAQMISANAILWELWQVTLENPRSRKYLMIHMERYRIVKKAEVESMTKVPVPML